MSIRLDGPYGVGHFQNTVYPLTVIIAGGIGITPAIGIATYIMRQAELSREETVCRDRGCSGYVAQPMESLRSLNWYKCPYLAI